MAEWLKAADCKSARIAYAGSNPAPSTICDGKIDPGDQFSTQIVLVLPHAAQRLRQAGKARRQVCRCMVLCAHKFSTQIVFLFRSLIPSLT